VDSFRQWTGKPLFEVRSDEPLRDQLYGAQIAVLSHGTEANPVLNYGNHTALQLWEMDWDTFTRTPSRLTAEPMEREERDRFFKLVTENGFVDNYTGVRISSTDKRFYIMKATVWNLIDEAGVYRGQAAAFTDYKAIE
jgi:hypothetical protein